MIAGAVAVAVALAMGVIAWSGADAVPDAGRRSVTTAEVETGSLSSIVTASGIVTFRARPDGSPFTAVNRASGTYTALPATGQDVACGEVLYRVDQSPVLLLCGEVPAFRDIGGGDEGDDVRQLNQALDALGYDVTARVDVDPASGNFTADTETALRALQQDKGLPATGALPADRVVFLPGPVRVAAVQGTLGGPAEPGSTVLTATTNAAEVLVHLDPSQQGVVHVGDVVQLTLLGNVAATGKVDRVGRVTAATAGPEGSANDPTMPVHVVLDRPEAAHGRDRTPVQVAITTEGVDSALHVPVEAVVGRSGGGFAIEVVRAGGRHEVVTVELGLVDTSVGRVQVDGDLQDGDRVVVPAA